MLLSGNACSATADLKRTKGLFERVIHEGRDIERMNMLGELFSKSEEGVPVDLKQAAEVFERDDKEGRAC